MNGTRGSVMRRQFYVPYQPCIGWRLPSYSSCISLAPLSQLPSYTLLFLQGAVTGNLSAAPAAAAAAVLTATAVTTLIPTYLRSGGSTDMAQLAGGFGDALKATFKAGRGWTGAFYSLSFWESFILGVALVGGPILPTVVSVWKRGAGLAMLLWFSRTCRLFTAVMAISLSSSTMKPVLLTKMDCSVAVKGVSYAAL